MWKVAAATLVIFLAGILTGATLVRFAQVGPRPWRIQRPAVNDSGQPRLGTPANPNQPNEPRPPGAGTSATGLLSREFVQILERQLQLTSDQRERIGKIMSEGQERVRDLRSRIEPELKKELQQTREQIRAVLTPEQREQFEQMMKRTPRRNERNELSGQPERRLREQREPRDQQAPPSPPDQ